MADRLTRRLFLSTAAAPVLAQFTSSVRVVNVYVTVRDKQGKLVRGLARGDFDLAEDGRRQTIRYFSSDSDAPLTVGLLFDVSGSQRSVLDGQKRAARDFLNRLLRPGDSAYFGAFDQEVTPIEEQALASFEPRSTSRGTALFDALVWAAKRVEKEPGRKTIVVLSDGIDTASTLKLDDAVAAAHRASAAIFPIHFYDREVFRFLVPSPALDNLRAGKRALDRLAKETGGAVFEDFGRIQEELRAQYSLGYSPGEGKAGYRKLRVQVKRRGLTVQARDGYFAAEP